MSSVIQNLKLKQIRIDGETQSRVQINDDVVSEYAESLKDGAKFPPVDVVFDGVDYWLTDGFHRWHAHNDIGALDISANVISGSKKDARIFAHGANKGHGLRRSNADKRKSVLGMLADAPEWSDSKIAKHVGVDHKTVASHRSAILGNSQDASPVRTVERGGKVYEQNTTNIGKKQPATPVAPKNKSRTLGTRPDDVPEASNADELANAAHTITELAEENTRLMDQIAIGQMEGSDIAKADAMEVIADLRDQVKVLEAENDALKASRDSYMTENEQLKRQCGAQRRRLEKLERAAA